MAKRKHDNLSAGMLYKLPEQLVDGYNLYCTRGSRKVSLVGRPLASGGVALVAYSYQNGRKVQQSLGETLLPETSLEIKNQNREKVRLVQLYVNGLDADLERKNIGFTSIKKQKEKPLTIIGYGEKLLRADDMSKGRRYELTACLRRIREYEETNNNKTLLSDISDGWVKGFLHYLRYEARSNRHKNMQAPPLAENTVLAMYTQLVMLLNTAVRERLIGFNPATAIERKEKPKYQNDRRVYLTLDEVQMLMGTPYPSDGWDVGKAFLFAIFTGLRFSDVQALTASNVERNGDGVYLVFRAKKTGRAQNLRLGEMALRYLPTGKQPGEPLFELPSNAVANQKLGKWVALAGIGKKVSFHVARHTSATLMLSAGCSIETVAFQLGHKNLATTQIYAKITNRAQAAAIASLDTVFLKNEDTLPPGAAPQK